MRAWPLALGLQEQGANHRMPGWLKARVVSDTEKASSRCHMRAKEADTTTPTVRQKSDYKMSRNDVETFVV